MVALVQKTAQQKFSGVTTTSRTITGVTAGNTVVCLITAASAPNPSSPAALPTPSGWSVAENPLGPGPAITAYRPVNAVFYKTGASAGSHTADFSGASALPSDSYGAITLFEIPSCTLGSHNTTLAVSQSSPGSTPSVSNTVADAIAFVIGHPDSGGVSSLSAPSGYTDADRSDNNSADASYDFAYKSLSATGSQSATWTWTGGSDVSFSGTIVLFESAGGGGVSGTVAWTEANDTAALTGAATASGTSAWTEANDAAAVTGSVRVSGTAAWTEANDTAALTGSATVSGTAAWTEANDAAAASGTATVSGSASWTEANDAAALTGVVGTLTVSGDIAWTEEDDIAALSGTSDGGVQLLGGGPGGPRKRRKDGTESHLERLLGRPLGEIEPEEIEVIEQAAEVAARAPQPPKREEAAESLREYGLALKEAYVQIFIELEQRKRQAMEEEEMLAVIAICL